MYSIASTASDIQAGVEYLMNSTANLGDSEFLDVVEDISGDVVDTLGSLLLPVLKYLQETPTRAIVISAAVSTSVS